VIDLTDCTAEVMDAEGDTLTLQLAECDAGLVREMRRGFEEGLEVRVAVVGGRSVGSVEVA